MQVSTIIKTPLALTTEQGEKLRDRIIKKLSEEKRVTLDCAGLTCISFKFLKPISELLFLYPEKKLKENLRFTNLSQFHADMVKQSFNQQKQAKANERNNNNFRKDHETETCP